MTTNASYHSEELDLVIRRTVRSTLVELGLDLDNPLELQQDFASLRNWRKSSEEIKRKGFFAVIGVFLVGALGFFWSGFKTSLH